MSRTLTKDEAFHKYVEANERVTILRRGNDGWYSIRCPARKHGKPLRMCIGKNYPLFYTDLGKCPEPEVFAGLVGLGMPAEYLKRPQGGKPAETAPRREHGTEQDSSLADAILAEAFGEGTATERLIRIAMLATDGELPNGAMVEVFAANLRVSPASIYRATADVRRQERNY